MQLQSYKNHVTIRRQCKVKSSKNKSAEIQQGCTWRKSKAPQLQSIITIATLKDIFTASCAVQFRHEVHLFVYKSWTEKRWFTILYDAVILQKKM